MTTKRKKKKLPGLWQRDRAGKKFGSWHVYIDNAPVNLRTKDYAEAERRRLRALRGERFRDETEGAVADAVAALGNAADTPPTENAPPPIDLPPHPGAASSNSAAAQGTLPPPDPVIEPERIPPPPPGNWADDVGATAGAAPEQDPAAGQVSGVAIKLSEFPWLKGALVTASKAALGLQLFAQAWVIKLVGDAEAGRVGPPPKLAEPTNPEEASAFMAAASQPWGKDDPRELPRKAYQATIERLLPESLPIPWWVEAPLVTAVCTLPVQLAGAQKIKHDEPGAGNTRSSTSEEPAAEAAAA